MTEKKSVGDFGEETAMAYLAHRGFALVQYSFRCRFGEIDIIARDSVYLLFVEVKTRRQGAHIAGEEAVDCHKQNRLHVAAEFYLAQHPTLLQPRFDVICVDLAPGGQTVDVRWIENAF